MKFEIFDFHPRPHGEVSVEAFSGLSYEGKGEDGEFIFWSHTDRGPNADSYKDPATKLDHRPFVDPTFQPRLTQFSVKPGEKFARYLKEIHLTLPDGTPMTGLPNFAPNRGRSGDEIPVTLDKKPLNMDVMGIDPEAICMMGDHFWLSEEYGPSILKFDLNGKLITRYVPRGYFPKNKPAYVKDILPPDLLKRKVNRGFEGMTCFGNTIYISLQSPLPKDGKNVLMLEFEAKEERMIRTFYYPLESMDADKIGDLAYLDGMLYVLEQNSKTGPDSFHRIYRIDPKKIVDKGVAKKDLALDLVKAGYDFADKVEGISMIDTNHIGVINDNDFGLAGPIDAATSKPVMKKDTRSRMAIIRLND